MKLKHLALAIALLCTSVIFAQDKKEHTVKVMGTAEMEVVPDEIYLAVTLKEYVKDKKKYTIEELEKGLVSFVTKSIAVPQADIKMDNMNAYIMSLRRKNKEEIVSKSYEIKFRNSEQVYMLYSVMDSLGISMARVSRYSHSKMDEYKKQIKINAIKAAKDKAGYLLEAIGSKAGKAVSVTEMSGLVSVDDGIGNDNYYGFRGNVSNVSQSYIEFNDYSRKDIGDMVGGKTIKLRYEISAEFEILP